MLVQGANPFIIPDPTPTPKKNRFVLWLVLLLILVVLLICLICFVLKRLHNAKKAEDVKSSMILYGPADEEDLPLGID